MNKPRIAIVSFPGNNGEVESMRVIRRNGMEPVFFRWNADRSIVKDVDGYFIPGGFSYEDRGRSGMVAARDPLMDFLRDEAAAGKVIIGICNGAQVLVESGLIPNAEGLQMALAHNIDGSFLSEWVWITRACGSERCATSNWNGVMHIPIAHGEGRFTTRDPDLIAELQTNDQIAFRYCDAEGNVSEDPAITPNGSMLAIAGVCNPEGNVIALMPHPERAQGNGEAYFASMREWMLKGRTRAGRAKIKNKVESQALPIRQPKNVEIFIEALITNNEERTVEQAARRIVPTLTLKQWKYVSVPEASVPNVLSDLTIFNANKESAYLRRGKALSKWNAQRKVDEAMEGDFSKGIALLRTEQNSDRGVAYWIDGVSDNDLSSPKLLEVFANPHSSTLERLAL